MKIYDASQLEDTQMLVDNGVGRKQIIYMGECFPPNEPRDKVYPDWVEKLGAQYKTDGYTDVVIDIEYLSNTPETIVWKLSDDNHRLEGVELWIEFMEAFRKGYDEGLAGSYGGHANWFDYVQFVYQDKPASSIEKKWVKFDTWERELRPMMAVMDTCYPSVYGNFAQYTKQSGGYYDQFTLAEYKRLYTAANACIAAAICHNHGEGIGFEWFFTTNKRGVPFPPGTLDFVLTSLQAYNMPVDMWTGASYGHDFWPDGDAGLFIGHNR